VECEMSVQSRSEKSSKTLQKEVTIVKGRSDEHSGFGFPFLGIGIRSPTQREAVTICCVKIISIKSAKSWTNTSPPNFKCKALISLNELGFKCPMTSSIDAALTMNFLLGLLARKLSNSV